METSEQLETELAKLTTQNARGNVMTLGQARGMIWTKGELPDGSPNFPELLSIDLLNHGFSILSKALRLRLQNPKAPILDRSFRTAAEAIESAVRNGTQNDDRGFHLVIAAAAFHLGHYGARSFSLLQENIDELNLSSVERTLALLMQRRLDELESQLRGWLEELSNTDEGMLELLQDEANDVGTQEVAANAIRRQFHRAIANFEFALRSGFSIYVDSAIEQLDACVQASEQLRHVPLWWACVLARHLVEDLWDRSLHSRLPPHSPDNDNWQELRKRFIKLVTARRIAEIDLWPSQLEAAKRAIDESDSLVVALPTSSGKTRVAELCILKCLSSGRRVIYVTPLRALSAQVEGTLGRTFRPLGFSVTSVYGASGVGADDVSTMRSAKIVVATPEKLDFAIRQDSSVLDDVGLIVLDEGHMIGFGEREIRYEVLVQRLLRRPDSATRRLVCLSAIFKAGDAFDDFTRWIQNSDAPKAISSKWRPTRQRPAVIKWLNSFARLEFLLDSSAFVHRFIECEEPISPRRTRFPRDANELLVASIKRFHSDGHAILVYCPMRVSVEASAKAILNSARQGHFESLISEEAARDLEKAKRIGREWLGMNHLAVRALDYGIAVHHGQLPRPFLSEIEDLLRRNVLPVAIASPTLAQGVDLSFSVLLIKSLKRGRSSISPKEFANVVGRVGRAFVDLDGIYAFIIHEESEWKSARKMREYESLVSDAKNRELESGLYLLIHVCIAMLKEYLGITDDAMEEYIVNQQPAVEAYCDGDSEEAMALKENLADLDAGILTLVENHDCGVSEIADVLDAALTGSYWRSRLAFFGGDTERLQELFIRTRAQWVWQSTNSLQRRGYYAAGVGLSAGNFIVANADVLRTMLIEAARAVAANNADELARHCGDIGKLLFNIYPFQPDSMVKGWSDNDWRPFLRIWLSGEPLAKIIDPKGISFVQEAIVFRLVWGVEAVRVVLNSVDMFEESQLGMDAIIEMVAVCLTYGVPNVSAARILESGMESRVLARRLVNELGLSFEERNDVVVWFNEIGGDPKIDLSDEESGVWSAFCERLQRERSERLEFQAASYAFEETFDVSKIGPAVRITKREDGNEDILTSDFMSLGVYKLDVQTTSTVVGEIDGSELNLSYFARKTNS